MRIGDGLEFVRNKALQGNEQAIKDMAALAIRHENLASWEAFDLLNRTRNFTANAPDRLTVGDIASYCDLAGIADPDQRMRIASAIIAMDRTYLGWSAEHGK